MPASIWSFLIVAALLPVSLAVTRLMIFIAPKFGLIDLPGERRIHETPIPRSGGLGIFITMMLGLLLLHWQGAVFVGTLGGRWLWHFIAAAGLLVITGFFDDRKGISAFLKLGMQIAAAVVMFTHNPDRAGHFMGFDIPWFLDLAIHVGWTVALINAFNLIDGMDGLCAGLGMIALLILTALAAAGDQASNAWVIAVMAVALLGFLRYNFHPARIFLGDTGSMLVGLFIASVGTATVGRHAVVVGLLLPLLVGGIPLLDVALAVWRRTARRLADSRPGKATIHIFGADRDHIHHRLLAWGLTQRQAVFVIYGFAGVISLLALLPILGGANWATVSVVGVVIIALVGLRYIAPVEFLESGKGLRALVRKPRSCRQTAVAYFAYDVVVLFGSGMLAWWIITQATVTRFKVDEALSAAMIFTFCTVVALRFARAHARRWTRASSHDFAECLIWMICGAGISFTILGMSQSDFSFRDTAFHLSAITLGTATVFAPRCIGFYLQESVIDTMHRKRRLKSKSSSSTALMYGAGDLGELFVCHMRLSNPDTWKNYHFVGFIDDSKHLKGRRMRGFPILGSLAQLPSLVKQTGANCIMITSSVLSDERMDALMIAAGDLGLEVSRWQPTLNPEQLLIPVRSRAGAAGGFQEIKRSRKSPAANGATEPTPA